MVFKFGDLAPKTNLKRMLMKFKFRGGASQCIMSSRTMHVGVSGSVVILSLEVLEQSREFANL